MARLTVEIGGRAHLIGCENGQEERVRDLARTLDRRLRDIEGSVSGVDHVRLLVMAALLAEDTARTALEQASDAEMRAARTLDAAAARVETLARRMTEEHA